MTERPALLLRIAPTAKPGRLADECSVVRIISEELIRTTTLQDVGCRKLLRQHMYGRARLLMLARPVRSPLHDVRQHAATDVRIATNKCSHGRDIKAAPATTGVSADNLRRSKAGLPTQPQHKPRKLVEPDGIEPTTSCLQSTRSPS